MDQSGAFTGDHVAFLYQVASMSCVGSECQIEGGKGLKFSGDMEISMGVLNSPQMGSRWDSHNLDLKYEI